MTDIFCELLSIKEPQTTLQNKGTNVQSYWKMSTQDTKKNFGIEVVLLTVRRRLELIILVVWIAHLLYSYFVTKLRKKIIAYVRLQLKRPLPPIRTSAFLGGPPFPSPNVPTLWMTPSRTFFLFSRKNVSYLFYICFVLLEMQLFLLWNFPDKISLGDGC